MVVTAKFWAGKRVFLTGQTGFKGGWLSLWLADMGAQVYGYALEPPTSPSFYSVCKVEERLATSTIADIRDAEALNHAMQDAQPEIVLHLAAQSLVRHSYEAPVETYAVNVMGTINLMEAIRSTPSVRAVVNVTSDKCYANRERQRPYDETEPLGGHDPYSSSKACSELITAAYRLSFLSPAGINLASARAGNVIGGGDWATDRLVPDFFRAVEAKETVAIRSPDAIRPWQHVLEPLSGYLTLTEKLLNDGDCFADAWNFGPEDADARSVQWIIERLCARIPDADWQLDTQTQPHEAHTLKLDSSRARRQLGWHPQWDVEVALDKTVAWHTAWRKGSDMVEVSLSQISSYSNGNHE